MYFDYYFSSIEMQKRSNSITSIDSENSLDGKLELKPTSASAKKVLHSRGMPNAPGSGIENSNPVIFLYNQSGKELYVYYNNEYKGILYASKTIKIPGNVGCKTISVESLDMFKAEKLFCIDKGNIKNWIISK